MKNNKIKDNMVIYKEYIFENYLKNRNSYMVKYEDDVFMTDCFSFNHICKSLDCFINDKGVSADQHRGVVLPVGHTAVTDAAVIDAAVTDVAAIDAAVTDVAVTDVAVTDAAVIDAAVTDVAVTDAAVTDAAVTDASVSTNICSNGGVNATSLHNCHESKSLPIDKHNTVEQKTNAYVNANGSANGSANGGANGGAQGLEHLLIRKVDNYNKRNFNKSKIISINLKCKRRKDVSQNKVSCIKMQNIFESGSDGSYNCSHSGSDKNLNDTKENSIRGYTPKYNLKNDISFHMSNKLDKNDYTYVNLDKHEPAIVINETNRSNSLLNSQLKNTGGKKLATGPADGLVVKPTNIPGENKFLLKLNILYSKVKGIGFFINIKNTTVYNHYLSDNFYFSIKSHKPLHLLLNIERKNIYASQDVHLEYIKLKLINKCKKNKKIKFYIYNKTNNNKNLIYYLSKCFNFIKTQPVSSNSLILYDTANEISNLISKMRTYI
ncbi:bromodomain protein, putative, partial [Hepatocystis sp. ex Piliocolobus tephrosceles]